MARDIYDNSTVDLVEYAACGVAQPSPPIEVCGYDYHKHDCACGRKAAQAELKRNRNRNSTWARRQARK